MSLPQLLVGRQLASMPIHNNMKYAILIAIMLSLVGIFACLYHKEYPKEYLNATIYLLGVVAVTFSVGFYFMQKRQKP